MAKPAITKRAVKAAALTYTELDTNFQNLADATTTLKAGTGGTNVTADLNGTITVVAGAGITLTGDNTAKTITITNSSLGANSFGKIVVAGQSDVDADTTADTLTLVAGSNVTLTTNATTDTITIAATVTGLTNPLTSNLSMGTYKIVDSSGVKLLGGAFIENTAVPTYRLTLAATAIYCNIDTHNDSDLFLRSYNAAGQVESSITLDRNGLGITLNASYAGSSSGSVIFSDGVTRHVGITTTQRDAIVAPAAGMIVYNTSVNKFQGYAGAVWRDFH